MKKMFLDLYNQLKKDLTLVLVLIIPILLILVIRTTLPFCNLEGGYRTLDALVGLLVAISVSFIISLYIIDRKNKKEKGIQIIKELLVGVLISFVYIMILLPIVRLSDASFFNILVIGILNAIYVFPITMMTIAFAKERKTAIKIISLTTIYVLVLAIPYVALGLRQFYFSFVPSFWLGKYAANFVNIYILWGIGISLIWSGIFYLKYKFDK